MEQNERYRGEPNLQRPPSKGFQCRETPSRDENGQPMVVFSCTLPSTTATTAATTRSHTLTFNCREPSCGVLNEEEALESKEQHVDEGNNNDDEEVAMDPFFFEQGYSLAGKTGWQVWPGSRIVVDGLLWPQPADSSRLKFWQERFQNDQDPLRILELGSGVGVVGSCLAAAAGAQVLETDLSILVENSVRPNLIQNSDRLRLKPNNHHGASPSTPPDWLSSSNPIEIGKGWVGTAALDWTKPLMEQLSNDQCQVDIVIASDCVWLMSMLDGVLSTVQGVFETSKRPAPTLLLSFQRRDPKEGESSLMFTSVDRILEEIRNKRWNVECLGWSPVKYDDKEDIQEVFLFEVTPTPR
jgi:hypothetical protein